MADLAAVTAIVAVIESIEQETLPAAAAITAGQVMGYDADGKWVLADSDAVVLPQAIACNDGAIGMPVTGIKRGTIHVGHILGGLAYGALVYCSDTAGLLADAATGGLAAIAKVVPLHDNTSQADKILRVML